MERYFQANRIIFIIIFIIIIIIIIVINIINIIVINIIVIIIIIIITIISRPHCSSRRVSLILPALCPTPILFCQWWVDLSDHVGNEFTDHQLYLTDFAVSIHRLEMCFFIYQLYLGCPENVS